MRQGETGNKETEFENGLDLGWGCGETHRRGKNPNAFLCVKEKGNGLEGQEEAPPLRQWLDK